MGLIASLPVLFSLLAIYNGMILEKESRPAEDYNTRKPDAIL
jgi:hypothetical protein